MWAVARWDVLLRNHLLCHACWFASPIIRLFLTLVDHSLPIGETDPICINFWSPAESGWFHKKQLEYVMNITRIEAGTIVVMVLAVFAGVHRFGVLEGQIEALDPDAIRDTRDRAIGQIGNATQSSINEINEQSAVQQLAELSDLTSAYMNRQWCDYTGHRNSGESYTNVGTLPIELAVSTQAQGGGNPSNECYLGVIVNGDQTIINQRNNNLDRKKSCSATVTIPAGATYEISTRGYERPVLIAQWHELRSNCVE